MDYKIVMGDKVKMFHVNMLKSYFEREGVQVKVVGGVLGVAGVAVVDVDVAEDDLDGEAEFSVQSAEEGKYVGCHISETLTSDQHSQIEGLIEGFDDVLSD